MEFPHAKWCEVKCKVASITVFHFHGAVNVSHCVECKKKFGKNFQMLTSLSNGLSEIIGIVRMM